MTRSRGIFLAVMAGLFLTGASTKLPSDALETVRHLAIQQGGRVKPFDSFARETLDRLTGSPRWKSQDPVGTLLSILAEPDRWQEEPLLSVPFGPLREALGLGRKSAHVSYSDLLSTKKLMRMLPAIVEKQQRSEKLTMLENETMDLFDRFVTFTNLMKQELNLVPPPAGERVWLPIQQAEGPRAAWERFIVSLRESEPTAITENARRLAQVLQAANPRATPALWRMDLEVLYNRAEPFRIARFLYLAAAVLLLMFHLGRRRVALLARGSFVSLALLLLFPPPPRAPGGASPRGAGRRFPTSTRRCSGCRSSRRSWR